MEEVSNSTRVRAPIVQAIEQDDFSRCGGDVYARGHIRTLARTVGIDPGPLIERYGEEHGTQSPEGPTSALFEAERIRPEPRRPNWTAAMVAAIVAVVGFVGFTLVGDDGDSGDPVAEDATAKESSPAPSSAAPADPKPDPSDSAVAAAPADKVTVKLTAEDGNSWISARDSNGRLMHQGVMNDGDSKTFTDDKRINLVLGNAGAIKLFVNGKEVDNVGDKGEVQRLSYTKGDPEAG